MPPLLGRLGLRPRGREAAPAPTERALMARTLAYLFAAAGLMGLVSLPFLPAEADLPGTLATAVAALAGAVAMIAVYDRLPLWGFALALAAGTGLITAALVFNGDRANDTEVLYLWVGLFSFYFLPVRAAVLVAALVGAGFAGALAATSRPETAPVRWMLIMGTLVVGGVVVRLLRRRVERLIARLVAAARTDPLTELLNRRAFQTMFEWEIARAERSGRPVSLLIGDLDRFKLVNDRYGHQAGDEALRRSAAVLDRAKRRTDTLARIGGEEFAVIAPDSDSRGAEALGERLRTALHDDFSSEREPLTISFGVSSWERPGDSAEDLMRAADRALYAAKAAGRDRTVVYAEGPETAAAGA
jgi:diguanylate cyclase (GGDEF)-like protein